MLWQISHESILRQWRQHHRITLFFLTSYKSIKKNLKVKFYFQTNEPKTYAEIKSWQSKIFICHEKCIIQTLQTNMPGHKPTCKAFKHHAVAQSVLLLSNTQLIRMTYSQANCSRFTSIIYVIYGHILQSPRTGNAVMSKCCIKLECLELPLHEKKHKTDE